MAYIYAFQLGNDNLFKIGKTTNSLELRRNQLQTGCPSTLTLFHYVETEDGTDALEGEHFIKQRYAARLVRPRSEIFRFTPQEALDAMAAAQKFMEKELPQQRDAEAQVAELAGLTPTAEMRPATEDVKNTYQRLRELTLDKVRLENQVKDVCAEILRLEAALKIAIGSASGIEGIATWGLGKSRGKFNPELVKAADPELFEQYVTPQFDTARFRTERRKDYSTYMETTLVRTFQIIDEP